MNSKLRLILHASPLLLLATQLPAQDKVVTATGDNVPATNVSAPLRIESARASELIGLEIRNDANTGFAKIDDLLIDVDNGRIVQVVVTGDDDKATKIEVPPRTFAYSASDRVVRWTKDPSKLKGAPKFGLPERDRQLELVHAGDVYTYYGEDPYFVSNVDAPKPLKSVHNHEHGDVNADRATVAVPLGRVISANKVIGLTVKDDAGNKVGTVDDLIIDLPAGRVVAVIISSGGFLGMGDSLSAVPPSTIRLAGDDKDELRLTASKDTLINAPRYKTGDSSRFNDLAYTDSVYRSYQTEPYSTVIGADNTRRNIRDRNNTTLTPLDQSNAPGDVDISARIRKGVIARDDLSVNAKNVKIITRAGQVTLRGPVKTSEEKQIIADIAAREAGNAAHVDNQLDVIASK